MGIDPHENPSDPDADLMLAVARGDQDAFAQLFDRHLPGVLNALYHYTHDRTIAEDLAQEAFLRVYRARDRYQPSAKFTTWLYRIVTNLAFNYQRDRKHRRAVSLDADHGGEDSRIPEPADDSADAPGDSLAHDELADAVADAITKLPDAQRMAIVLNRYQDMSYQEIADTMDITVDAVKSLLARARGNLRELLNPFWSRLHRDPEP